MSPGYWSLRGGWFVWLVVWFVWLVGRLAGWWASLPFSRSSTHPPTHSDALRRTHPELAKQEKRSRARPLPPIPSSLLAPSSLLPPSLDLDLPPSLPQSLHRHRRYTPCVVMRRLENLVGLAAPPPLLPLLPPAPKLPALLPVSSPHDNVVGPSGIPSCVVITTVVVVVIVIEAAGSLRWLLHDRCGCRHSERPPASRRMRANAHAQARRLRAQDNNSSHRRAATAEQQQPAATSALAARSRTTERERTRATETTPLSERLPMLNDKLWSCAIVPAAWET